MGERHQGLRLRFVRDQEVILGQVVDQIRALRDLDIDAHVGDAGPKDERLSLHILSAERR